MVQHDEQSLLSSVRIQTDTRKGSQALRLFNILSFFLSSRAETQEAIVAAEHQPITSLFSSFIFRQTLPF